LVTAPVLVTQTPAVLVSALGWGWVWELALVSGLDSDLVPESAWASDSGSD
jgi:hypothetical protein